MQIGDPKKAGLLILIAVLAIGFAVFRSIPKPEPRVASAAPTAQDGAEAPKTESLDFSLPVALVTDPFSHPKLASAQTTASVQIEGSREDIPSQMDVPRTFRGPTGFAGPNGYLPVDPGRLPGIGFEAEGSQGGKTTKPGETTGGNRNLPKEEPPISIKLSAILRVEKTVALVQVGSSSVQVSVGDYIGKFKVISISDTEMVLKGKSGSRRVGLGKEVKL